LAWLYPALLVDGPLFGWVDAYPQAHLGLQGFGLWLGLGLVAEHVSAHGGGVRQQHARGLEPTCAWARSDSPPPSALTQYPPRTHFSLRLRDGWRKLEWRGGKTMSG
jgi:hypothetical protein